MSLCGDISARGCGGAPWEGPGGRIFGPVHLTAWSPPDSQMTSSLRCGSGAAGDGTPTSVQGAYLKSSCGGPSRIFLLNIALWSIYTQQIMCNLHMFYLCARSKLSVCFCFLASEGLKRCTHGKLGHCERATVYGMAMYRSPPMPCYVAQYRTETWIL